MKDEAIREAVEYANTLAVSEKIQPIIAIAQSYLAASGKMDMEEGKWRSEFQYLLDRKILSRDELAYLFGQIKSVQEQARHSCIMAVVKMMSEERLMKIIIKTLFNKRYGGMAPSEIGEILSIAIRAEILGNQRKE